VIDDLERNGMAITQHDGAVVALVGRRIDPEPTLTPRFPFDQIDRVSMEIADQLRRSRAVALVCSAACGADLIALETAQKMGLRTRIILPFSAARFRETSVVDRPRPEFWGNMFDRVASAARAHGDLVELDIAESDGPYLAASAVVIDEAQKLAGVNDHEQSRGSVSLVALVVWEGASRGGDDNTYKFVELAQHSGFQIEQVLTLNAATERAQP
jgi:hypothetical protein